ncbi:hypothetical protein [Hyphomicrobium sp. ghe19]|uniref:hypothetical protein n=1 Tax=Hyphomicrobium sp. ghe19 TaxID=2682968 RepID=UPI0013674DFC|nr:hypothetical protein HYPP_00112 [Hyphomicrobium sp. ghe19]
MTFADQHIRRRHFLSLLGAGMLLPLKVVMAHSNSHPVSLLTAPLELGGSWRGSSPADAVAVIERMRAACLKNVSLVSDHQPERLRVDDKSGSNPSIWLHDENPTTAWMTVIVGTRDWCNLAYQFGHELGHVLCNSWEANAKPRNPCQWIEESLVEAFSLHGLGTLANDWERTPPFPHDAAYASSIRDYRANLLYGYGEAAHDEGASVGLGSWFKVHGASLQTHGGLDDARGAVSTMFALFENDPTLIVDLGALNRWPGRSGVPVQNYLDLWQRSCLELGVSGKLPVRLRELLTAVRSER